MNTVRAEPHAVGTAVPARVVAEHIRWMRSNEGEPTTPLHLVKLVYIAHGWTLGLLEHPLIRERVEAWKYGPVIPAVYHRYKPFGGSHIDLRAKSRRAEIPDDQRAVVEAVEEAYRRFTAIHLSALTHRKGSPWYITFHKYGQNAIIPNPLIQRYYAERVAAQRER